MDHFTAHAEAFLTSRLITVISEDITKTLRRRRGGSEATPHTTPASAEQTAAHTLIIIYGRSGDSVRPLTPWRQFSVPDWKSQRRDAGPPAHLSPWSPPSPGSEKKKHKNDHEQHEKPHCSGSRCWAVDLKQCDPVSLTLVILSQMSPWAVMKCDPHNSQLIWTNHLARAPSSGQVVLFNSFFNHFRWDIC